jgi:hypothetical protein
MAARTRRRHLSQCRPLLIVYLTLTMSHIIVEATLRYLRLARARHSCACPEGTTSMRPLERLKAGRGLRKDIDVYATAIVALTVAVLGLLNIVNTSIVVATTLATLTLVATSALASRNQVSGLDSSVRALARLVSQTAYTTSTADRLLSTSTSGAAVEMTGAGDIRLVGVTLSRTIRNRAGELERRLAGGARIKIALIDPTSTAPKEAARRCTIPDDAQIFEHRLKPTLDLLQKLARTPQALGCLEVRFLRFVPSFGLTMIDPCSPTGRVYVDIYSHRSTAAEPVLSLGADSDPRWYRHFVQEFDRIWDIGRPANSEDGFAQALPAAQ